MVSWKKRVGVIVLAVVPVALAGAWILWKTAGFDPPALPDPNGYDDFIQAGRRLAMDPSSFDEQSMEELTVLVASNAPALAMMRAGLEKACRVPLAYTIAEGTNWAVELPLLKQLAQANCAEARLQSLQGHPVQAAETGIETIRFGTQCCVGGTLLHRMVGHAIEMIGAEQLRSVYRELDALDCRRLTHLLEQAVQGREPLSVVADTERAWSRRSTDALSLLRMMMATRSLRPALNAGAAGFSACEARQKTVDRLLLEMAARAHELEQGHPPATAADLVPAYLHALPIDPSTEAPMEL